eukprot:679038-Amphidinium_carterae.4
MECTESGQTKELKRVKRLVKQSNAGRNLRPEGSQKRCTSSDLELGLSQGVLIPQTKVKWAMPYQCSERQQAIAPTHCLCPLITESVRLQPRLARPTTVRVEGSSAPKVCVCVCVCLLPLTKVVVGHDHSCVLFTDGRVKCWGANTKGQLGYQDTQGRGGSGEGCAAAFHTSPKLLRNYSC